MYTHSFNTGRLGVLAKKYEDREWVQLTFSSIFITLLLLF